MTAGVDLYIRQIRYTGLFTQDSTAATWSTGFQTGAFSRMFVNYSLERSTVKDLNPLYLDPRCCSAIRSCRTRC